MNKNGTYIPLRLPGYLLLDLKLQCVSHRYTFSGEDRTVAFSGG